MADPVRSLTQQPGYAAGSYVLFGAIAVILGALAFEHIGGLAPCPLCLMQRYAYYLAIPLAFAGLVAMSAERRTVAGLMFLFVGLAFLANMALAGYHAGAEWGFWPGPSTCGNEMQPLAPLGQDLRKALENVAVPNCTEPAIRILGLSLSGWNAVACGLLAGFSFFTTSTTMDPALEATT